MRKEKGILPKIKYVLIMILSVLSVAFTFLLMLSAITRTAVANNMTEQMMTVEWEKPFSSLFCFGLFIVIGFIVVKRSSEYNQRLLFSVTILIHAAVGVALIVFGRTGPAGDPGVVYSMAEQAAVGNFGFVSSGESYLSYYPQQIGLTVFLGLLLKGINLIPFNVSPHHAIKVIYVILNCVSVTFGYLFVKEKWKNYKVNGAFLYLSMLNLPFMMYSSFIYGEVPSFTAMTAAAYFLLRIEKKKGPEVFNMILFVLSLVLAVFVRKNSLIFAIATLIVLVLMFLGKKKSWMLVLAVTAMALCICVLPLTLKYFENKTGSKVDSGVTMYSYLAMGMQEGGRGPGWYNGFNYNTYRDTGMNTEEANKISSEAIKERKQYFKDNPKEAVKFYTDKFLTQWSDPTLASCQATWADFGGRSEFMVSVYEGKYNQYYVMLCNAFQNMVCIGAFIWSLLNLKTVMTEKKGLETVVYLGIITVIGGFIFHMIWEANSRYIFPYAMLLMPYAASGIAQIFHFRLKDYEED